MVDKTRLAEVREHMEDSCAKWNILLAQSDRQWLLKQVETLQAKVEALEAERAVYDGMAGQILRAEDERILAEVSSDA